MATTDDRGVVKYWQSNMNNVHSFQAHSETIRGCRWELRPPITGPGTLSSSTSKFACTRDIFCQIYFSTLSYFMSFLCVCCLDCVAMLIHTDSYEVFLPINNLLGGC